MTKFFQGVSRKKKIVLGVLVVALVGVGAAFILFNQTFSADTNVNYLPIPVDNGPDFKISLQASAKTGNVTAVDPSINKGGNVKTLGVAYNQPYTIRWSVDNWQEKIKKCTWHGDTTTFFDGHESSNPADFNGSRTYTATYNRSFNFHCRELEDLISPNDRNVHIDVLVKGAPTAAPTPTSTPTSAPVE